MKLKELCEINNIEYNDKNPKRSLEKLQKIYVLEKNGRDYNIVRELSADEQIQIQLSKKILPHINQFHVTEEDKNKSGVYKIVDYDNKLIYIGQTKNFYKRFLRHCNPSCFSSAKPIINNGGFFEIIAIEDDPIKRLQLESEWCDKYKNEYTILNTERVLYSNINKVKYKNIKVKKEDYEKVADILNNFNIEWR